MNYVELDCQVAPGGDYADMLIAYLAAAGYTMFEETSYGVKAYIPATLFNQQDLDDIPLMHKDHPSQTTCTFTVLPPKNWNEEWEKNFQPVIIGKEIYVRAEYHVKDPAFKYELVIQPRMAFGTGHHATTVLVMEEMLETDFGGRQVLDMGCGTGILAILASKLGAAGILAIDNDSNAVENTRVNCEMNETGNITVLQGDSRTPGDDLFDVILANINRNIILEDASRYAKNLAPSGTLITSGYYEADLDMILKEAENCGLSFKKHAVRDNWCMAVFVKTG